MDPHPPNPQGVPASNLQHSYTKRDPLPPPLPQTHREYHPPTYNTHALIKGPPPPYPQPTGSTNHQLTTLIHQKGPPPPTPNPQGVPPTILQHSYTKGTPYPPPLPPTTGCTTHHLTTLIP